MIVESFRNWQLLGMIAWLKTLSNPKAFIFSGFFL